VALKEQTVLVVDDDAAMRDFLKSALAPEKLAVFTAATGEDGIKQALSNPPDLLLVDLRMPATDGVAVCKAIRANTKTEHTPILVVTGSLSREQIEESMTAGADDFVSKPIDVRDLRIRVRALLQWRHITDPVERLQHYVETVREMTDELAPPSSGAES
jgi:DNA-binding response OmpR family regulator